MNCVSPELDRSRVLRWEFPVKLGRSYSESCQTRAGLSLGVEPKIEIGRVAKDDSTPTY